MVSELGYLGISVKDVEAWKAFGTNIIGLELLDEGEGDRFYFRMDTWHHRIVVHHGGDDDLAYLGWRVKGPKELEQIARRLDEANVPFKTASRAEAQERRVVGLLKLDDPGGNPTEIFWGPRVDFHRPFHPGRPLHGGFVTGDQGLGHCILRQADPEAAAKFYTEVLGMEGTVEYQIPTPDGMVATDEDIAEHRVEKVRVQAIADGSLVITPPRDREPAADAPA